jgi:REP element-mobilizing transposase RayT
MGFAYRISDQQQLYFITATINRWVDVFTRPLYVDILLDSLRFSQANKGLQIYGWVVMSNHFHAIVSCSEPYNLSYTLRDIKKFTASRIVQAITKNVQESRRSWLLWLLRTEDGGIKVWEEGNHPEEIWSQKFFLQKLEYIHNNPVKAGIVRRAEDYIYSSAFDFATGGQGLLPLSTYEGHYGL